MSLRSILLASACLVAAGALAPASAANFDGVFGADYSHLDANGGGGSANAWGLTGSGVFGFSQDWAGEVDGGYQHVSQGVGSVWNIDGSVMYRGGWGRVGGVVGYNSADNTDINVTNYGGFVDFYASHAFTVSVKAGGFNASHNTDGDYVGAQVAGYVMPDFAITGGYDYTHLQHAGNENDWSVGGEWLVSETTPVSVYASYTNSKISGGGPTINVWTVGVHYYVDSGPATLVDRQRAGAATYGTSFGPTLLKF